MVLSIGEILVDIFVDGEHKSVFPGGAPFNLACNIADFEGEVAFLGAVGKDEYGDFLSKFAKEKLNNCYIEELENRHTSEAIVTLRDGERSFRFNRDSGADYALTLEELKRIDLSQVKIVHIGSLMLSFEQGRTFFKEAIEYIKANSNALISFDVNYRDDIFASEVEAKKTFLEAIKVADILKFTEEELTLLSGLNNLDEAIKKLLKENQVAFVTLGKEGSLFFDKKKRIHADTFPLVPIDTTGAGDAFYSYVLYELDHNLDLEDEQAIRLALKKANFVGGYATQRKGAIGVVPSIKQIKERFA